MIERDLISGEPSWHEAGRDTGRWCVLPREALLSCRRRLPETTENRLDEETPKRVGAEGGRFTGSTEETGPMADICSCNICIHTIRGDQALVTAWRIKP